jgi:hypothetical protein
MPAGSFPILAGTAPGADPWRERDRLAQGRPGEITALARAFARGAGDAQLAADLGRQGSQLTAQGYTNDGAAVHRLDEHVARSRTLLTDAGGGMRRVATILDAIADDLVARTADAQRRVADLETELLRIQREWDAYDARYRAVMARGPINAAELAEQYRAERGRVSGIAAGLVDEVGRAVAASVADYDWELGRRSRDLNDLGYAPPADLDAGPGDVGADPDAGARDGQRLAELLDEPAGAQNIAEIDALSGDLRALAARAAEGGRLTDGERQYLTTFFDALGPDALAALPQQVRDGASAAADPARGPDGMPLASPDDVYRTTVAPFGDAILGLSRQIADDAGGAIAYQSAVPAAVRSLLDTPLGVVDPATGARWMNDRFLAGGDQAQDPRALIGAGVAGADRYRAVNDVLTASTARPGSGLAAQLTDSAIRVRQELNAVQENARSALSFTLGGGADGVVGALDRILDDTAASNALSVAARDVASSSRVLLDDARRPALLGLDWEDATGAAELVTAGTSRDGAAGGGGVQQAGAALAVVREVAGDRDGYLGRMSDPVQDAVAGVGTDYVDALAAPTADRSGLELGRTDGQGRELGPSFELSRADRDQYLQFVSGSGDERAADFQARATTLSQVAVAGALAGGAEDGLAQALIAAGRLDGAMNQAHFEVGADRAAEGEPSDAAGATRAAAIDSRAQQGFWSTGVTTVKEVGAELLKQVPVAGPVLSVVADAVRGGIGVGVTPDVAAASAVPDLLSELRDADAAGNRVARDLLLAEAADLAGRYADEDRPAVLDRPPGTSPTADGSGQDELTASVERVYREEGLPTAQFLYGDARQSAFTGEWSGRGVPADSAWTRGDELYYGTDAAPEPVLRPRTADPRLLDDPAFDPIRQELTGR